ncbi:MAG: 1-deoxy-D-xylulose-5-phosphate reductoisomerase [Deltaproteobacteria bacterium]|nr:1-deoxy-D-xylulose-5-phosphate reductoisomerase [Deltaproteobacteria bacterium]
MKKQKGIAVLGSTGSIGTSTLDVVRANKGRFKVVTLAAGKNIALLKKQIREFAPHFVSVTDEKSAEALSSDKSVKSLGVDIGFGTEGAKIAAAYKGVDMTVSAIVGFAGLIPTLHAIKAGKDIALANKEALVAAGPLVMNEVKRRGVSLIPVDSEHSAVFQCLKGHDTAEIERIILTASGGPFLRAPLSKLKSVTPGQALKHPNWEMGRRITIDSATMMNKGFEVIEAKWLFGVQNDKIDVVVHPESIVHSMVEYVDGSVVAQLSTSDMRGPISYALGFPGRIGKNCTPRLELGGRRLEFLTPEKRRFPCLTLAYEALEIGGTAPAVLNAADEVCVEAFLKKEIGFMDIARILAMVLGAHRAKTIKTLDDVLDADMWARDKAASLVK